MARILMEFASLKGANLADANLRGSGLAAADLTDADVTGTNFEGADLNSTRIGKMKNVFAAKNAETGRLINHLIWTGACWLVSLTRRHSMEKEPAFTNKLPIPRAPWNKRKMIGAKPPPRPNQTEREGSRLQS